MLKERSFEGQVAWVIGGGSGIGQGACLELAKQGVKVIISGRSIYKLEQTKALIESEGGYAESYVCDITKSNDIKNTASKIIQEHGKIDIFINSAGELGNPSYSFATDDEVWDNTIRNILTGTFNCINSILPSMIKNKYGRIIVIGSAACIKGMACNVAYASAKGGLTQLVKTIAKEVGSYGVTCNIINPGIIETPMADGILTAYGMENLKKDMIVKEIGQVENVSHCIMYLADPKASHVTGAEHDITGGMFLSCNIENWLLEACKEQIDSIM